MSFICIIIKTHFHNKGFALSLVLKVKLFGTRKWPIGMLEGPQALPALRLAISISICVAVTGKIKKLSGFDVLRYSSGDLITFGIELASRSPISAKYLQNTLAIDFVSVISE